MKAADLITASEHDIQTAVMGLLNAHRIFAFRLNTGAFGGTYKGKKWFVKPHSLGNGAADIMALVPLPDDGWIPTWMEVKRPGKKQSEAQIEFQKNVESWGHRYVVVTSIDDAMRELKL